VPSGGTSDYAPEMLHAAAQGKPYACLYAEDVRIPFMAMPDAVNALLTPSRRRASADATSYNITAFSPLRGIPEARPERVHGRRHHLRAR